MVTEMNDEPYAYDVSEIERLNDTDRVIIQRCVGDGPWEEFGHSEISAREARALTGSPTEVLYRAIPKPALIPGFPIHAIVRS